MIALVALAAIIATGIALLWVEGRKLARYPDPKTEHVVAIMHYPPAPQPSNRAQ